MSGRAFLYIGGAALGLALLLSLYLRQIESRQAQRERDSTAAVIDSLKAQAVFDSAAAAESLSVTKHRVVVFRQRQIADSAAAADAAGQLRATLDSGQRVQLDSIEAAHARELADVQAQRRADSAFAAFRITQLVNEITKWKAQTFSLQTQLDKALARGSPKFACVGGAGASIGLSGGTAGLTIACGIPIHVPKLWPF